MVVIETFPTFPSFPGECGECFAPLGVAGAFIPSNPERFGSRANRRAGAATPVDCGAVTPTIISRKNAVRTISIKGQDTQPPSRLLKWVPVARRF
jgi:hypothetical protein